MNRGCGAGVAGGRAGGRGRGGSDLRARRAEQWRWPVVVRAVGGREWGLAAGVLLSSLSLAFVSLAGPQRLGRSPCPGPAVRLQLPPQPGGACLRPPEWCASSQASAPDPGPLCSLPRSSSSRRLGGKNFRAAEAVAAGTPLTPGISASDPVRVLPGSPLLVFEKRDPSCHPGSRKPQAGALVPACQPSLVYRAVPSPCRDG